MIAKRSGITALMGIDLIKMFGFYIAEVNKINKNEKLNQILEQFKEVFKKGLGRFKDEVVELKIIEGAKPIFCKPRQTPFAFKETVETELDRLEEAKVMTKIKNEKWGTPIVSMLKPDGNIRVCADYRVTVNKVLEDVNHPIPRIKELFVALQGGVKFMVFDMSKAYNQLVVSEETRLLLAWSTHRGIYAMNRLPFGTKPAVAIFQQTIEKILQGLNMVKNFLDDVIITGKNEEEHFNNLKEVLMRFEKVGLRLNLKKCIFFQDQVKYFGHIIDKSWLKKDLSKIEAIVNIAKPKNGTEVKVFIGMVNYYAKFFSNLAARLHPLYNLLKKNSEFV